MKEFTFILKDKNGLHARPAGMLSALAKSFKSDIKIKTDAKEADAKRLLSLMSLGAKYNTTLTVTIEGEDEQEAYNAILAHTEKSLGGE
ncbi:MAG: HPr family phosphocarrier protein [Clostridia bacterium]|nr:HPr family phosphocarrier protein [Clostridia bacterium]